MRLNIRAKMIATSALLVAFVVAVMGFISYQMTREDLAEDSQRTRERREEAMKETGILLTRTTAQGALPLLADWQVANLTAMVNQLVSASGRTDIELIRAAVLDRRGQTVAFAPRASDDDASPSFSAELFGLQAFSDLEEPKVTYQQVDIDGPSPFSVIAPVQSQSLILGYVVIDFGVGPLLEELAQIEANTQVRIMDRQSSTMMLGVLAIILGVFIAIIQSLSISGPILKLSRSAEKISAGDLDTRVNVRSRDEIGRLGRNFNRMAERIQTLLEETAEKATMQKELEVARVIQETLLPPTGVIDRDPLHIYGYFRSASVCGGDFWNVVDLNDGRTLVVIGDVTGHGVPSAMITATAKSSLDTIRNITSDRLSLTFLLEEMNRTIFASAKRKFVMTFFALVFDRTRNEILFSNAGHNFPLLVRKENGNLDIRGLVARGNRLGDVENSRYMEHRMHVQSGDLLVLYTDGLTEYRNHEGDEYSERRFRRLLKRHFEEPADEIGTAVLKDLSTFAKQSPQEDDVTLVVVKIGQLHRTAMGEVVKTKPPEQPSFPPVG